MNYSTEDIISYYNNINTQYTIKNIVGPVPQKKGDTYVEVEWEGNDPKTGRPYENSILPLCNLNKEAQEEFLQKWTREGKDRKKLTTIFFNKKTYYFFKENPQFSLDSKVEFPEDEDYNKYLLEMLEYA